MVSNIFTLDIEGWYQSSLDILGPEHANIPRPVFPDESVVRNTWRLLRILAEYDVYATCFVLGTVAETYPDLVREIHAAGHEVATHGYGHELIYKRRPEQFRTDLQRSIDLLESIISEPIDGYRAPYFSITRKSRWALEVLAEMGIHYDSSIFPIRRNLYGFSECNRFPHIVHKRNGRSLLELPISTFNILRQNFPVGGGGYLRFLPYPLVRGAIRTMNRQGQPAVFYLHPYELDTEELCNPLPGESRKTRFVRLSQRLNRRKVETKLHRLLEDFEWTSVRSWMADQK